ncbi:MAG TPA: hypothetical protein VNM48_03545 [Chloroflexota bacterium]|nr:hypothetical protein [Chloroflexota bacterium]
MRPALASLIGAAVLTIPVGEQATAPTGEIVRLEASVAGEMAVQEVPITSGVDVAALTAGDERPMEIVVAVPAGKSRRGWDYKASALQDIVRVVGEQGLPGYLGHQRADAVDHEFPPVATHWIGAKWENGRAYFRGVVDPSAGDLKRWLKARTVRTVSIFGVPKLERVRGETHVTGYDPLSIDWTPLGRNGMPTSITAMTGEMDAITGTSAGAATPPTRSTGVTLEEALAELRKLKANPAQVLGEMGWQPKDIITALNLPADQLAPQVVGEQWASLQAEHTALGEIATALGLADAKPADVVTAVKAVHTAQQTAATAARTATVERVIGEMVNAEPVRPVVRELVLPKLAADADEAAIKTAVGEVTALDHIKTLIGANFGSSRPINPVQTSTAASTGSGQGVGTGGSGAAGTGFASGLRVRSASV